MLQGLEQGDVLRHVVILVANPFGDSDRAALDAVDDYANTGRPRISQRTAVNIGYEMRHPTTLTIQNITCVRTSLSSRCLAGSQSKIRSVQGSVEKEEDSNFRSATSPNSIDCNFSRTLRRRRTLHQKGALTKTYDSIYVGAVDDRKDWFK